MVQSFIGLCLLLWLGYLLRLKISILQKLYLPSCVISGIVGLIAVQILKSGGGAEFVSVWTAGWSKLPGFLINIVFACLFLGVALPPVKTLWHRAGPQLAYGQVVAWGQYMVGIGLVLAVLGPVFGVPDMFGAIIPIGFEGGHGTAGGMGPVFEALGYPEGKDFGLASATAGIFSAIIVGMVLVNWAARRGYTERKKDPQSLTAENTLGVYAPDNRPSAGKLSVSADAIEAFSLHVAVIGLAILLGWLGKQGLLGVSAATGNKTFMTIAKSFPLFPLCMLGGLIVQLLEDKFDSHKLIDHGLTRRIQNVSLDFLVVAAIATINVKALIPALAPFLILVAAGIMWNVGCVTLLARRVLPNAWFERSIAEMGQSMGVTATGLLLLRVVDPEYESPAADAFASKQLLHEPFMGGGIWTSAAVPLLALPAAGGIGGVPVFLITAGAVVFWLVVLAMMHRKRA